MTQLEPGSAMALGSEIAVRDAGEASTIGNDPKLTNCGESIVATEDPVLPMKKSVWRAIIEVGFIVFLFYSNLLMGEFERSGMGQKRGVAWAIGDVFTAANFEIATIAAIIGYILFEFLRKKF
jgi:hypothetical protein